MRNLFLLLVFISNFAFAQTAFKTGRAYNDTLPQKYLLDADMLREHIYRGVPASIRNGEYSRRALNFSQLQASYITRSIADGTVYSDWSELENYLNDIMQKIMPPELKADSMIHVYVVREGSFNAYMTASGHAFVHIGLLPEVPDEATIAGILLHELGHYYLRHSLYTFLEAEAGNFDKGVFFTDRSRNRFSIKNEIQADSIAAVWMKSSGYSLEGLVSAFRTMHRLDRNILKQLQSEWELKENTHPQSEKRLERLNEFYSKSKSDPGKSFLVSESLFNKFKEEVKPEILKTLLDDFNYRDCVQKAFRFHLFDPDNSTYVYYIMESIRRKAYLDVTVWKEMFITNMYYDSLETDGHRHKQKMTNGLFKKFDFDIIPIDMRDAVKIKARFYWRDTPKFNTYEEAYNFFYKVGELLNCSECILSNALSFTADTAARNSLLLKYLAKEDIQHREYAQNLYKGTIFKNLGAARIIGFSEPWVTIDQGYEKIPIVDKDCSFTSAVDSINKNQASKTAFYFPSFKKTHLNDYRRLIALQNFSMETTVSRGEKTELHILDPDYWEMFHKYNVNEIEFVQCRYYEERMKDNTVEGYRKVLTTDFNALLGMRGYTKYLDVLVTSVREKENCLMKIRHYNGQNQLNSKTGNFDQIVKTMRYEIALKETRAIEADGKYRLRMGK